MGLGRRLRRAFRGVSRAVGRTVRGVGDLTEGIVGGTIDGITGILGGGKEDNSQDELLKYQASLLEEKKRRLRI